jgi:hypothetical protein
LAKIVTAGQRRGTPRPRLCATIGPDFFRRAFRPPSMNTRSGSGTKAEPQQALAAKIRKNLQPDQVRAD